MTRVDRTEQLLDSLRQQLLERAEAQGLDSPDGAQAGRTQAGTQRGATVEDLRGRLIDELRAFDLSTEAGRKRARISFIESVLTWEFGTAVVGDSKFLALVEKIDEAIGLDHDSSVRFDGMLSALGGKSGS
jgi:hypothetical protein